MTGSVKGWGKGTGVGNEMGVGVVQSRQGRNGLEGWVEDR